MSMRSPGLVSPMQRGWPSTWKIAGQEVSQRRLMGGRGIPAQVHRHGWRAAMPLNPPPSCSPQRRPRSPPNPPRFYVFVVQHKAGQVDEDLWAGNRVAGAGRGACDSSEQAESRSERATVRAMLPSSLTVRIRHTNSWVQTTRSGMQMVQQHAAGRRRRRLLLQ